MRNEAIHNEKKGERVGMSVERFRSAQQEGGAKMLSKAIMSAIAACLLSIASPVLAQDNDSAASVKTSTAAAQAQQTAAASQKAAAEAKKIVPVDPNIAPKVQLNTPAEKAASDASKGIDSQ